MRTETWLATFFILTRLTLRNQLTSIREKGGKKKKRKGEGRGRVGLQYQLARILGVDEYFRGGGKGGREKKRGRREYARRILHPFGNTTVTVAFGEQLSEKGKKREEEIQRVIGRIPIWFWGGMNTLRIREKKGKKKEKGGEEGPKLEVLQTAKSLSRQRN